MKAEEQVDAAIAKYMETDKPTWEHASLDEGINILIASGQLKVEELRSNNTEK